VKEGLHLHYLLPENIVMSTYRRARVKEGLNASHRASTIPRNSTRHRRVVLKARISGKVLDVPSRSLRDLPQEPLQKKHVEHLPACKRER